VSNRQATWADHAQSEANGKYQKGRGRGQYTPNLHRLPRD
jgi:hypothetical protein